MIAEGEWVAVGVGSNLEPRMEYMVAGLRAVADDIWGWDHRVSSIYETEPVDCPSGGAFLNAVVAFRTDESPMSLLSRLQGIEARMGRTRPFFHAPRTLDLDLLFFGNLVLDSERLTLPHVALHRRRFVLSPLQELGLVWVHPRLHVPLHALPLPEDGVDAHPPNPISPPPVLSASGAPGSRKGPSKSRLAFGLSGWDVALQQGQ